MEHPATHPLTEPQIKTMLNQGGGCLIIWGADGKIIDISLGALAFFGVSSKEAFHKGYDGLSPKCQPDGKPSKDAMNKWIKHTFKHGTASFDWLYKKASGLHADCRIRMYTAEYLEEKVVCAVIQEPGGEEKEPEHPAVSLSSLGSDYLHTILEHAPVGCFLYGSNFDTIDCNRHGLDMLEVPTKGDMNRSSIADYVPENQPNGEVSTRYIVRHFILCLKHGHVEFPLSMKLASGREFTCEVTGVKVEYQGSPALLMYLRETNEDFAVTKRNKGEYVLWQRLQAMMDASPILCQIFVDGEIIDVNQAAVDMLGIKSKQEYIDRYYDFSTEYQPDGMLTRDKVTHLFQSAMNEGQAQCEWLHKAADGTQIPCEVYIKRVRIGEETAVIAYARDLREQKALQRELREREALLQQKQIYEASPIPFSLWNEDLEFVDCNMSFVELLGAPDKQNVLDRLLYDYQPPKQPDGTPSGEKAVKMLQDAFKTGRGRLTWVNTHRNGSPIHGDLTLVRLDIDGSRMLACYFQDLRPLREADEKLREADEVNNILLGASPFIMNVWDDNYNLVSTSRQAVEMFDLDSQQEYIEKFFEFSPEYQPDGIKSDEKALGLVKQAFTQDEHVKFEWMHCKQDGEPIPAEVTLTRFMRQGRYFVAAYTVDLRPVKAAMEGEREAHSFNRIIVESAPFVINLWDGNYNIIGTNPQAVRLHKAESQEHFVKNFYDFSPEYQPDGSDTREKGRIMLNKAYDTGYAQFEWMHCTIDGEPIPCTITLVRGSHKGKTILLGYTTDLREVKAAEAFTQELLDNSPMFIEMWNEAGDIIECNSKALELFGLSSQQEFIDRYFDFSPEHQPDGTPSAKKQKELQEQIIKDGQARYEWVHLDGQGRTIPVETSTVRLKRGGETVYVNYNVDLREVKSVMEREREANELTQMLLNSVPLSIEMWDCGGNLLYVNQNALDILGLDSIDSLIANRERLSPECQPDGTPSEEMSVTKMREAFEKGFANFEWLHLTFNGEPLPVETTYVRTMRDGKPVVIGYNHDLRPVKSAMERVREAEKKLLEQEMNERMQIMLDAAPLFVEFWDKDVKLLDCNKTTLDFYKLKDIEAYKRYIDGLYLQEEPGGGRDMSLEWDWRVSEIIENGYGHFEYRQENEDGDAVFLEVDGVRMKYHGEIAAVTYSRDITRFKELQEEQHRAAIAEESNRAKTMFIASMSHEIRTPMNSILGYSELALDGEITGKTRDYLEKIVTNTKWLLRVISDLLDISKIESGNLVLEEIPYDIAEVAEYCHSLFYAEATRKGLEFLFDTTGLKKKNVRLIGDPTKLTQICVNILSNAVKFTNEGTITLVVSTIGCTENTCKYNCDKEACTLKFEVRDTGIGLTEEQIQRIFEPFVQADIGTKRKYGGTGLGLAIAKRFIEAMGGRLSVESTPGAGSTFSFVLDFKTKEIDADSPRSYLEEKAVIEKPEFNGEEVLVVDDNIMNIGVACEHLSRVNLKPFIAKNGIEAVDAVKRRIDEGKAPFDLIFMDIHMPEMDGKEAGSIISGLSPGTPIIAMTAEVTSQTDEAPYGEYGMKGHLSKPFTAQEIWRCLLKYLGTGG